MERYGKSLIRRIEALGAKLVFLPEQPAANFIAAGYMLEAHYSIIEAMLGYAGSWFTAVTAWLLPKTMREGLVLHVFRSVPRPEAAD